MADETQRLAIIVTAQDQASKVLGGISAELKRLSGGQAPFAQITKGAGQVAVGLGRVGVIAATTAAAGLTAAAKAGIDFQDAFAGVRKTVNGTPAELDAVYASLRQLAMRVPVSFTDIAGVAQQLGALGINAKDIPSVTEDVVRLSAATTGLSSDAAADAFGRLGNVLQLHGADFQRVASVLVDLGNNAASSEGDILDVGKRFAAAGHQAHLSAAEILAWSSTLPSLGVLPEAAGSSLSRIFNRVTTYIGTADGKLKSIAKTAGMTTEQFGRAFGKDASGTMIDFLKGLSKLPNTQAAAVLKAAGLNNIRDQNAILLLAQNYPELIREINLSNDAYAKNNALTQASAERFNTLKSHITELKNGILNAGVDIAEGMDPAIDRAAQKLLAFLQLPETHTELVDLGKEIGDEIDKINWQEVIDGAKTLLGIGKQILDVFSALGPKADAGIIGAYGLDKLSGGLIGKGIGNIVAGAARVAIDRALGGAAGGVAAKGAGGLLGAFASRGSFANPMWVRIAGAGALPGGEPVPGNGASAEEEGAAAATGRTGMGVVSKIITWAAAIDLGITAIQMFNDALDQGHANIASANALPAKAQKVAQTGSPADIATAKAAVAQGQSDLGWIGIARTIAGLPPGFGPAFQTIFDQTTGYTAAQQNLDASAALLNNTKPTTPAPGPKNETPSLLREQISLLKIIASTGKVNADQADKVTEDLLWHSRGGSVKTLSGAIDRLRQEQKTAIANGDQKSAERIGRDIGLLQQRLATVEERRGQQLTGAMDAIGGILDAGFGGVIAAVHGISIYNPAAPGNDPTKATHPHGGKPAPGGYVDKGPGRGGGRASGGPVWPGMSYDVGERGRERLTMYPGGGGYVTPLATYAPRTYATRTYSATGHSYLPPDPIGADRNRGYGSVNVSVKATVSHRDVSTAGTLHGRYGPTAAEAGAI